MIVDANILLYAAGDAAPHHEVVARWLADALNGDSRVGLPAQSVAAFVRIVTNPRITTNPLGADEAWEQVAAWMAAPAAWVPDVGRRTMNAFGALVVRHGVSGNLVPDAMLAASAVEHGVPVVSVDSDFARFPEVTWIDPTRPG